MELELRDQRLHERKGWRTTLFIHFILVLLSLLPFFKKQIEFPIDPSYAIEIEFEENIGGGGKKSTSASESGAGTPSNKKQEKTKVVEKVPTPTPKPQPQQKTPPVIEKPVLTDDSEAEVVRPEVEETVEEVVEKDEPIDVVDVLESVPEVNEPVEVEEPVEVDSPTEVSEPQEESGPALPTGKDLGLGTGGSGDGKSDSGSGSGEGTGGNSSGGTDDSGNDGKTGSGYGEGDGSGIFGDGDFNRTVIESGNIAQFIEDEGIVVIKVCVDRAGNVIMTDYIEEESSLTDKEFVKNVKTETKNYKFNKDNTAPKIQCGKLTFIFKRSGKSKYGPPTLTNLSIIGVEQ